jgi:phosphatidylinositol 4-kinase
MPRPLLVQLLRAYACRAQLDLLTSLQDISTRLILVPKPARLSALRAELTVLNHGLPRGCCLGIGCPGEGRHHRVVRISPSEAVVLNSADRAPFLLQGEVLEEDLDFDPTRRQSAEDVRKVVNEREAAIARQSYRSSHPPPRRKPAIEPTAGAKLATAVTDGFGNAMRAMGIDAVAAGAETRPPPGRRKASHKRTASDGDALSSSAVTEILSPTPEQPATFPQSPPRTVEPPSPSKPNNEEVDLVEQLYGDAHLHDLVAPVADEPYSPKPIQNRSVDEAAWQRGERRLLSPELPRSPASAGASSLGISRSGTASPDGRGGMTLDQYAERMRMAAVMLAQLSASQQPSIGITGTATELVGAGVGLGAGLVGAALGRLPFVRTPSHTAQSGQGSTGVSAKVDTSTAAAAGQDLASPRQRILSQVDATAIRERIMREMMDLEAERMERMRLDSRARSGGWTTASGYSPSMSIATAGSSSVVRHQPGGDEDASVVQRAVNKDDPSGAVLRESWTDKRARIRAASPYGHLAAWDLLSVIVKTGADLRQEQLAVQLIREFGRIWADAQCPHWVR